MFEESIRWNPLPDEAAQLDAQFENGVIVVKPYWESTQPQLMGEGIVIDESLYLRMRGRIPDGMGRWNFRIADSMLVSECRCPYSVAARAARELAYFLGEDEIEVIP